MLINFSVLEILLIISLLGQSSQSSLVLKPGIWRTVSSSRLWDLEFWMECNVCFQLKGHLCNPVACATFSTTFCLSLNFPLLCSGSSLWGPIYTTRFEKRDFLSVLAVCWHENAWKLSDMKTCSRVVCFKNANTCRVNTNWSIFNYFRHVHYSCVSSHRPHVGVEEHWE